MENNPTNTAQGQAVEKLAYSKAETCQVLGVCGVTLWRLEKQGLIIPAPGTRRKVYSKKAITDYLDGKTVKGAAEIRAGRN